MDWLNIAGLIFVWFCFVDPVVTRIRRETKQQRKKRFPEENFPEATRRINALSNS